MTYLYKLAFRFGQLGKASAISLIMFSVLFVFTTVYVLMVMRQETDATAGEDMKHDA